MSFWSTESLLPVPVPVPATLILLPGTLFYCALLWTSSSLGYSITRAFKQRREMPSLKVLLVDRVPPSNCRYPPPGDTVPLSFFDTYWIDLPPVQSFFLYPDNGSQLAFPSLLQTLKSSLSEALLLFHPLAGKLTYLPTSGDVVVDCTPAAVGDGVAFIEAESDADIGRLASDEAHDLEAYVQLVPELDVRELPAPVFAVQVTRFAKGGVAIGYAALHTVVDGRTLFRFMEAWSGVCKGASPPSESPPPSHDRSVITYPNAQEIARCYVKQKAPALPLITAPSESPPFRDRLQLKRRTFTVGAESIKSLKERGRQSGGQDPATQPSTFAVVSAHAWISFAHAKGIKDDEATTLVFTADCRARLDPPIELGYTGNCVRACYAMAMGSELLGKGGLARACSVIKHAVQEFVEEPLRGCVDWVDEHIRRTTLMSMYSVGSPRFPAYEIDFGWGRPSRVELVSMNHDGEVVSVAGREEGEVQVSVALSALQMDTFASIFSKGLGDNKPLKGF